MNDATTCVLTPAVNTHGFDALGAAVHRASTIVFANAAEYAQRGERGPDGYSYGLYGTPTTRTLERKLTLLERGSHTFLTPSGQASNSITFLAILAAGDHVLIADACYPPVRDFADQDLRRLGVEVGFYDPSDPEDVARQMKPNTKLVWCESPGSTTMEVQDLPRIVEIARRHNALVGCDNTWATPLNYKPLELGADLVTEALTKYISGHADVIMGSISIKDEELGRRIRSLIGRLGIGVSPDDASLVLRGFETLPVRLKVAADGAQALMRVFQDHRLVDRVLHPALPSSPGHEVWRRDFSGSNGVLSVAFKPEAVPHVASALDRMQTIAIGASWGSTRSLAAPMPVRAFRSATPWAGADLLLRISVGLEHLDDLRRDVVALLDEIEERTARARQAAA